MPFLVIQYDDNGKSTLCTIPSQWVVKDRRKSIVYWPPLRIIPSSMFKNETIVPAANWVAQACKIKRSFSSYKQAYQGEILMSKMPDTDGCLEDSEESDVEHDKNPISKPKDFNTAVPEEYIIINNNNGTVNEQYQSNEEYINTEYQTETNENIIVEEVTRNNNLYDFLDQAPTNLIERTENMEFKEISAKIATINTNILNLTTQQKALAKEMELLSDVILKLDTKLDLITKTLENQQAEQQTELNRFEKIKANSVDEVNNLEKQLDDSTFLNGCISALKSIVGNNKARLSTQKIFSLILDALIDREVLTNFSWTGMSKTGEKENFSCKKNITSLIFRLVSSTDSSYTVAENEKFIHMALRNSQSRCNQKSELKRKGLEYNTKTKKNKLNEEQNKNNSQQEPISAPEQLNMKKI